MSLKCHFPGYRIRESLLQAKEFNPVIDKVIIKLESIMEKRGSAKLFLFVHPNVINLAEELSYKWDDLQKMLFLISKHCPEDGKFGNVVSFHRTVELENELYYLDKDEIELLEKDGKIIHPYDPDGDDIPASKIRDVFIVRNLPWEHPNPRQVLPDNFSEWIKGFEHRYSDKELFLMRWIWEIRSKNDKDI